MKRWIFCAAWCLCAFAACQKKAPVMHEELRVFAASSLTEALQDVAAAFEQQHPEVTVLLNFAGSQTLRLQIEQGAPADVFASASEAHMDTLLQAGRVDDVSVFAQNTLVLVVPAANPANIERFLDLALAPRIVVGAVAVPIGAYTKELLQRARTIYGDDFADAVESHIVSREANVRLALAKIELGEADAAFVYRTDVSENGRVKIVPLPESLTTLTRYVVGAMQRTHPLKSSGGFIRFLRGPQGQAILKKRNFLPAST